MNSMAAAGLSAFYEWEKRLTVSGSSVMLYSASLSPPNASASTGISFENSPLIRVRSASRL